MNTRSTIAVTNPNSPGITLTLENTGVFLAILVSVFTLAALGIRVVSTINRISSSISQIEQDIKEHANNSQKITELGHKLDLHIQDYVNRKDTITLLIGQTKEVMEHRTNRLYTSMKDVENFLQTQGTFKIREFQDLRNMEEKNPFNKL